MPLPVQSGEVANRLRSLLGIRGRIPTQFDENLVGAAILDNMARPPYRTSPILAGGFAVSPAVAAERSFSAVGLPLGASGQISLETCLVSAQGVAHDISLFLDRFSVVLATGASQSPYLLKLEQMSQGLVVGNAGQPAGPILIIGSDPAVSTGIELLRVRLPAEENVVLSGPLVVPAGGALGLWSRTNNQLLHVSWRVEYYADVPFQP